MGVQERPCCPRCGSVRVVKCGHARGKQRWLCRRCQYQFTRRDGYGTPDEVKQAHGQRMVTPEAVGAPPLPSSRFQQPGLSTHISRPWTYLLAGAMIIV